MCFTDADNVGDELNDGLDANHCGLRNKGDPLRFDFYLQIRLGERHAYVRSQSYGGRLCRN